MSVASQWAPTAPDGRWVPTLQMVEEHRAAQWERIRRSPRSPAGPRRIADARRERLATAAMLALAFACGAAAALIAVRV